MFSDIIRLALNNVRRRGLRSWLTMIGIFIGIAAVVSLISLGGGLQNAITGQFSTLGPDRLVLQNTGTGFGPPGSTAVRKLTQDDLDIVKNTGGVISAVSRLIRVVKVEYNKAASFSYVASVPDKKEDVQKIYEAFNLEIDSGRLLTESDRKKVVLGSDFIENDEFGKPIRVGSHLTLQGEEFEVVGILKKASSFQVNSVILMPEQDMRDILNLGNEIDLIAIQIDNPDHAEQIANTLSDKLRRDRGEKSGEEDFSIQTPVQALGSINTILTVINIIISGIAAISLIVGGIGITNTMYTSVLERTKEIGVMKAIGAKNRDIMLLFLIESGLLGLVGGVVGAILGLGMAIGASKIVGAALGGISLEISPSLQLLFGAVGFSFLIGTLSGMVPALQASRLKPVEALRSR